MELTYKELRALRRALWSDIDRLEEIEKEGRLSERAKARLDTYNQLEVKLTEEIQARIERGENQ